MKTLLLLVYNNKPYHLLNKRCKGSSLIRDKHITQMDASDKKLSYLDRINGKQ